MNNQRIEQRLRIYLAERVAEPAPIGIEQRIIRQTLEGGRGLSAGQPWPMQLITAAAVIVVAVGLAIAILHARSNAPVGPRPSPSSVPFYPGMLHMVTPTIGWAGQIYYRTTDGGIHWVALAPAPAPLPDQAKGGWTSFALDVTHAWVTRTTGPLVEPTHVVVSRTLDGGRTWSAGNPVPTRGGNPASQLDFIDAQQGWVVVDTANSASPNSRAIYATKDGGLTWRETARAFESDGSVLGRLAAGCLPSGITFVSTDSGWLTYDCSRANGPPSQYSGPVVAVTRDGGLSWQVVPLPSYPSGGGWTCWATPPVFTSNNGILPVTCAGIAPGWGGVYETADAGRRWTFHPLPFWPRLAPDFIDARTGWAVSQRDNGSDLYGTTDGGRTWTLLGHLALGVDDLRFFDTKTGYYAWSGGVGPGGPGGVLKTTDGGRTWTDVHPALEQSE